MSALWSSQFHVQREHFLELGRVFRAGMHTHLHKVSVENVGREDVRIEDAAREGRAGVAHTQAQDSSSSHGIEHLVGCAIKHITEGVMYQGSGSHPFTWPRT